MQSAASGSMIWITNHFISKATWIQWKSAIFSRKLILWYLHSEHAYPTRICKTNMHPWVWRYWSLVSPMWWCFLSHTFFFYKHIKHMAAICVKFGDFAPCPLYICLENLHSAAFLLLCVFTTKPGVLDLQSEHEFSTHIKPLRFTFTHWVNAFFVQCIQAAHGTLKCKKTASPSKRINLCEGTCCTELIMWSLDADSSLFCELGFQIVLSGF